MAEDKEPAAGNKLARAKFKGIPIGRFLPDEIRDRYSEISGKPDFIMVSFVRLNSESIEEMDTYILQESKDGSGLVLTSSGDRTDKAKKFIEALGGEATGK